jgi:hypothetical protein
MLAFLEADHHLQAEPVIIFSFTHSLSHCIPLEVDAKLLTLYLLPDMCLSSLLVGEFCFTMIGRADFESKITMNTWLPSYPCGDFSDSSSFKFQKTKGSIGQAMLSQFVFVLFYQVPRCFHPSHSSFLAHNSTCYAAKILHYVTAERPLRVRKFVLVN